ncbi:hypothetical protein Tco_1057348 [Tanacetum coccineum]|uniref:Uncharacterized protein n=1 Tax=Tanacetum coccineum TaxID=301880 RepID=A0ABQ5H630_9ASTR
MNLSAQYSFSSTVDHYKSKTEEVKKLLKKDFKQKEDKFLEEFFDLKKIKDKIEDRLYKQGQSAQTVHMLCQPKSFYDEKHKVAIGYKRHAQSAVCNGHMPVTTNHTPTVIHDSEDTYQLLQTVLIIKKHTQSPEAPDFRSFFKIKNLEHQIQEKDNVIGHLKDIVTNVKARSREPMELFDSIKILRTHTSEKTSTMLNEIESLKAQLRSKAPCFTSDCVKPKVLAPGMYAIDVKPIPSSLKNNRRVNDSTEEAGQA